MSEPSDDSPKSKSVELAQRALELKRAGAKGGAGQGGARTDRGQERAAAARSASKSRPAMKK
jgi:hypothetical protein